MIANISQQWAIIKENYHFRESFLTIFKKTGEKCQYCGWKCGLQNSNVVIRIINEDLYFTLSYLFLTPLNLISDARFDT